MWLVPMDAQFGLNLVTELWRWELTQNESHRVPLRKSAFPPKAQAKNKKPRIPKPEPKWQENPIFSGLGRETLRTWNEWQFRSNPICHFPAAAEVKIAALLSSCLSFFFCSRITQF
tara:strand:- start:3681 stop:4028 length:348 start_codon:yes stop_codon:yes gene_type:complete